MSRPPPSRVRSVVETAIAFTPWVLAMYSFYWLDSSGTWTRDTPHRGKLSILLLTTGMVLSLFAWSYLTRRTRK